MDLSFLPHRPALFLDLPFLIIDTIWGRQTINTSPGLCDTMWGRQTINISPGLCGFSNHHFPHTECKYKTVLSLEFSMFSAFLLEDRFGRTCINYNCPYDGGTCVICVSRARVSNWDNGMCHYIT